MDTYAAIIAAFLIVTGCGTLAVAVSFAMAAWDRHSDRRDVERYYTPRRDDDRDGGAA